MMSYAMFDAVLFDMDGLLIDTERAYMDGFLALAANENMPSDQASYLQFVGMNSARVMDVLVERLGSMAEAERFFQSWAAYVRAELIENGPAVKPYARELLDGLAHLPKAVVTSSETVHAHEALERVGLLGHFEAVIGVDQVSRPKPDPQPYLMGAQKLGVDITRCAIFEDSAMGIRAAVASGGRAVQVPDLVAPDDATKALGHHIAPDLLSGARAIGLIA